MQRIRIETDGEVATPTIAGTDVRVASVLALLEQGWSFQDIRLVHYPDLTAADMRACVVYSQRLTGRQVLPIALAAARPAGYQPSFGVDFGMPLLLVTILTALVLIYYGTLSPSLAAGMPGQAQSAAAFKAQGDAAYASEQLGEAERWYLKALEAEPSNAAASLNLGLAYYREKRFVEAETLYRRAAALDPADATAHFNLGLLFTAQHRPIDARAEIALALARKPEDSDFHYSLGKVYCDLRQYDQAIPQFEYALRVEPTNKRAQLSIVYARKMLLRSAESSAVEP